MAAKNTLRTWARLMRTYAKMDALYFLRDTRICLLYMFSDSVVSISGVFGMLLLAGRLGQSTGFSQNELYFLAACALLVNGLYDLFFMNNNAGAPSRIIGRGQLDHALIQPVPLPLHFITNGFAPASGCGTLLCGVAFSLWAAARLPGGVWLVAKALPLLVLSVGILFAWVYGVSALAFWAPYAAEEIAPDVTALFSSLAAYPLGVLGRFAQFFLCGLLPVGAMAWLPTSVLLGKAAPGPSIGFLAATAAASGLVAATIFRKGLNHYAKVSCPRYTGFGR